MLPAARQIIVTNLVHAPRWLVTLVQEHNLVIETTFALGARALLDRSVEHFQERFIAAARRLADNGITLHVNLELNRETVACDPARLIEIIRDAKLTRIYFDISVQFDRFLRSPRYNADGYPVFETTITHAEHSRYLLELEERYGETLRSLGVHISNFDDPATSRTNNDFNVNRDGEFITLNPDGTVTSNPLFSDLEPTYLGNLETMSFDRIVRNPKRLWRIAYEAKRRRPCVSCPHLPSCQGGPSHVPLFDESGECAGHKLIWDRLTQKNGANA